MLLIQALIMATLAMLSKCGMPMWSRWSLGMGAPLIAGFLNGILMGDVADRRIPERHPDG